MRIRRIAFLLTLGLVLGLFATACAGALLGQSSGTTNAPSLFGPMFETLSLPALGLASEANAMRAMSLERTSEALLRAQEQMLYYGLGECDRAHHFFDGDDG